MKEKMKATTRRMMPILAQIVQRCKIELAADEKIKAREFSYSAQSCLLMLGQLAYWCIKWAKHRQRKAAVKLHMVANVANMLPKFADEEEGSRRTHGAVTSRHVLGLVADYVGRFDTEAYRGAIGRRNRLKENFRQVHCVCQYNLL